MAKNSAGRTLKQLAFEYLQSRVPDPAVHGAQADLCRQAGVTAPTMHSIFIKEEWNPSLEAFEEAAARMGKEPWQLMAEIQGADGDKLPSQLNPPDPEAAAFAAEHPESVAQRTFLLSWISKLGYWPLLFEMMTALIQKGANDAMGPIVGALDAWSRDHERPKTRLRGQFARARKKLRA